MEPISRDQVVKLKVTNIPDIVIETFNNEIAANWNGSCAVVLESDIAQKIAVAMNTTVETVYKEKYLDVEPIYRKKGWKVEYDKPGYCETYPATYRFS